MRLDRELQAIGPTATGDWTDELTDWTSQPQPIAAYRSLFEWTERSGSARLEDVAETARAQPRLAYAIAPSSPSSRDRTEQPQPEPLQPQQPR